MWKKILINIALPLTTVITPTTYLLYIYATKDISEDNNEVIKINDSGNILSDSENIDNTNPAKDQDEQQKDDKEEEKEDKLPDEDEKVPIVIDVIPVDPPKKDAETDEEKNELNKMRQIVRLFIEQKINALEKEGGKEQEVKTWKSIVEKIDTIQYDQIKALQVFFDLKI